MTRRAQHRGRDDDSESSVDGLSDDDSDPDGEGDKEPAAKKRKGGARKPGGGRRCICGPNGCKRNVNEGGFRLPAKANKRLSWLHCWFHPDDVPEKYLEKGEFRVHECHFAEDAIELKERKSGRGAQMHAPRSRRAR